MRQTLQDTLKQQRAPNLSLADQILNEDQCKVVSDYLSANPNFQKVELRGCNIGPKGFQYICKALILNKELKELHAEWNTIGTRTDGISALYDLVTQTNIQLIDLKNNRIGPQHCQNLAQIIKYSRTLSSLNLKWNEIGEKGAQILLDSLKQNKSLIFLDLSCNKIPEELSSRIREIIEKNRSQEFAQKNQKSLQTEPQQQFKQTLKKQQEQTQPQSGQKQRQIKSPNELQAGEQARMAQLKEQIEQELRNNRLTTDELERRIDALKTDIMNKEEALLQEERRNDALLQDKNYIEQEHSNIRAAIDHVQKIYEEKQSKVMNEYIVKNKHVLGLENDFMREMQNVRSNNKSQVQQIHNIWAPKLAVLDDKYNALVKENDDKNQEVIKLKEMFLKMRLTHDDNIKSSEQRFLIEFKEKYGHQTELLERQVAECEQALKHEEKINEDLLEDSKRLEKNLMKERNYLEEQIQLERERIHKTHFDMSKKNLQIEKYRNKNLILSEHQEKLKQKVMEANRILGYTKESTNQDMHQRRGNQEQQYLIHKQNQAQMHQRIMDLELILKNQEVANQKLKTDYERLASQIQNRVSNTIAEIVRSELQFH